MYRLKVKEVAEQKKISQRQLFIRSGIDPNTIRRIYRDPQAVITVETLARLARVLNVDVSELIESTPDERQIDQKSNNASSSQENSQTDQK